MNTTIDLALFKELIHETVTEYVMSLSHDEFIHLSHATLFELIDEYKRDQMTAQAA